MNNFRCLLKNDLKRLFQYGIFYFIIVLSFLFAMAMAIFPRIDPSNFFYIAVFILPVIVFSISLYLEKEEMTLLPLMNSPCKTSTIILTKTLSALIVEIIPFVLFVISMILFQHLDINYFVLLLVYLLGATLHILIGLSLSIISKNGSILSLSYIAYIVIFSIAPIFFSNGLIPMKFEYLMIISPAYLSGVLIDNTLAGMYYSQVWLIVLSVFLQIAYGVLLAIFVINPYFKTYLLKVEFKDTLRR